MKSFFLSLFFIFAWLTSTALNVVCVYRLRLFYMTDDIHSDYFKMVAAPLDNVMFIIFGFLVLLLLVLLNVFYQTDTGRRFVFVSSIQTMIIGVTEVLSAPIQRRISPDVIITTEHTQIWGAVFLAGVLVYLANKRMNNISTISLLKSLFKIRRSKFW